MATMWDERYEQKGYFYGKEPNAFLVSQKSLFKKGMKVLAVGDGEGRNGVWIAGQGCDVLSVDGSEVGLIKARELARERHVKIETKSADFFDWDWPQSAFDAVVSIFIHVEAARRPQFHRKIKESLKPGGFLVLEGYTPEQLKYGSGGPKDKAMLFTKQKLLEDFAGMEILKCEERMAVLHEGLMHEGDAAVVDLVARLRP